MLFRRPCQWLPRLWVLLLLSTALYALPTGEKLTQFGRQNWQTENGLPQNTIHAILQSPSGFLWLGTDGGLVRFDGFRFATYDAQNTPALGSNNIEQLAVDGKGEIWFSTPDGIGRWVDGKPQLFTRQSGLPPGRSWSLAADRNGQIWASSDQAGARFSNTRFGTVSGVEPIDRIFYDQGRSAWALARGSIRRLDGGARYALPPAVLTARITAVASKGDDVWLGTDHGVWRIGTQPLHYSSRDGLPSDRVTALLADRDNALWVGTENGIARLAAGRIEAFPAGDPLSNDAVNAMFEDSEGDIWIGGDTSGLTELRQQKFVTYSFRQPDGSPQIRCVLGTRDGTIWMGTDGGGLKRFRKGQFSTLTTSDGLSSNVILSLAATADGTLLVGTPDGLNRIAKDSMRAVHDESFLLAEDFVRSIYVDRDGTWWIGTRRGLSHVTGQKVRTYTQADGLGSDTVGTLLRDASGALWIGTLHGLSRLDKNGIRNYSSKQGLSGQVVTDLYEDAGGTLWIATQDGGLSRYRGGVFQSVSQTGGLPKAIFGMTEDRAGNLWMVAKGGVFRASAAALEGSGSNSAVIAYGTGDGLRVSEGSGGGHPALWNTESGDIWFATANGAARLRSAANSLNRVVPPVAIETVSIDGSTLAPTQLKPIPPGKARVSFEYAGLSFLAPQKVEYKYRLEGFDKSWIDAGTRRVAFYTNLPPRSYRFRVIARNNDGFWNDAGASLPIRILPHFYQTWWFYLIELAAAALMLYALYVWRLRQVQSRFEAVLAERNRIAREIHDTLAQGFVGVSMQLELVSRLLTGSSEAAREHLDQARILVRKCLAEARQSIWELRSQTAETDFAGRFSRLAQQVSESSSVKVQLEVQGQYRPLKPVLEDELFRIGQEAITNAVRHSGAQQVRVNLTFDSRKLRMTIVDDGCGFSGLPNSHGPDGHFGLKGMRERAERIHAQLNLESAPGAGTTVSVEAPAR